MIDILTVCTGNVCRSALSDVLLRARLKDLGARVSSAGSRALIGTPLTPETAQLAERHGAAAADVDAHRGRQLTEQIAGGPDLALAMTRDHRRQIVELAPMMLKRTFTAREFARLSADMTVDQIRASATGADAKGKLRSALRALANRRGVVGPPADPADDDVIDPYLRDWSVYELEAAQLVPAVDEVARFVRAAVSG